MAYDVDTRSLPQSKSTQRVKAFHRGPATVKETFRAHSLRCIKLHRMSAEINKQDTEKLFVELEFP